MHARRGDAHAGVYIYIYINPYRRNQSRGGFPFLTYALLAESMFEERYQSERISREKVARDLL